MPPKTKPVAPVSQQPGSGYVLAFKICAWLLTWWLSIKIGFGAVYFCVSALFAMFFNLGKNQKPGQLSAYSVFNKDAKKMAGSLDASQFEREIRHQSTRWEEEDDETPVDDSKAPQMPKRLSKLANKPCPCGSGKKFKKCCSPQTGIKGNENDEEDDW
eukprot:TRINITY_DN4543_c0_g1_i1.p1 TRINITY_DN4543_c0_g1~~TRINITY_DN4543_c0_g1_i1.p1  ORF type:complete len:158 (-),score=12.64 TRINITY_DN4543_c0_g1_i1:195-668(-)